MGYVDSYNPYQFALFDPINYWDPWGLNGANLADRKMRERCDAVPCIGVNRGGATPKARWQQDNAAGLGAALNSATTSAYIVVASLLGANSETVTRGAIIISAGSNVAVSALNPRPILRATKTGSGQPQAGPSPETTVPIPTTKKTPKTKSVSPLGKTTNPSSLPKTPTPKINDGRQGKHIVGHNNYMPGRSILRAEPEELVKRSGTGTPVNQIPRGQNGFKERVDFGKVIGEYSDGKGGQLVPTTMGLIVYSDSGKKVHIIPARPKL